MNVSCWETTWLLLNPLLPDRNAHVTPHLRSTASLDQDRSQDTILAQDYHYCKSVTVNGSIKSTSDTRGVRKARLGALHSSSRKWNRLQTRRLRRESPRRRSCHKLSNKVSASGCLDPRSYRNDAKSDDALHLQAVPSTTPPSPVPYLPAGHGVHSSDPARAKCPLVHVSQA